MSLKTAWLNLQDSLGNRFAWSHVNAVYYNWAQKKLLKEKLDDIDTAINAKVAKTDIVQVESTATDKVPSCAYIKNIKDELDGDIAELNSKSQVNFTASSFSQPIVESDASYAYRVGNVVFLRITVRFQSQVAPGATWIIIPEGYRPAKYAKAPAVFTLADGQVIAGTISIWPDGIVAADGGAIADRWCFVYVSYPVP